ncbi:MAG: F0F1 ATP synthase subunit gamma [Labilithrix sp.]|nr:F0F1 ATP synthase subunit gamma [Labilithrix sp.]
MTDLTDDITAVERSMRAVGAIRQVLHAVWALSRAQLPLVEQAASAAATYQSWVDGAADRVAGAPYASTAARTLTVVFGPERPYSSILARRIAEAIPDGDLGIVGQRLAETIGQSAETDRRVRFRCPGSVAHDDLHDVAFSVAKQILEHGRGAVVVVIHPLERSAELARVPLIAARGLVDRPPETFSPLARVVERAVVEAMTGRLAVAAAEALRAEIRARMEAADTARRACDERLVELEGALHLGRRETITRELLEIVAGGEAAALMTERSAP